MNSPIVAFVLASIFIIALLAKEKKTIDISYLLPVFATLFMTAKYMRIAFHLVFCTIMLIWKFLYDTEDGTWFDGLPVINIGSMLPTIVVSCCIVAMLIFQPIKTIYTSEDDGSGMSKELLSAIHELAPERMYNDYNTGGFLIYNGLQSFIDSRADLFPD